MLPLLLLVLLVALAQTAVPLFRKLIALQLKVPQVMRLPGVVAVLQQMALLPSLSPGGAPGCVQDNSPVFPVLICTHENKLRTLVPKVQNDSEMLPKLFPGLDLASRQPVPHSVLHVDVRITPKPVMMQPLLVEQHLDELSLLPEATE